MLCLCLILCNGSQARDKLSDERRSLAEVIRQEFSERLIETEEENRRMKMEVSEAKARLRLEVERVTREKEEELAEVHQRSESKSLVLLVPCLEPWLSNN